MSQIRLAVPVLVQNLEINGQWQFLVRPLFFQQPIAVHRRLETALQHFKNAVRESFNGYKLRRSNMDQLFWYKFNPGLQHTVSRFQFYADKTQYVDAKFSMVSFKMGEEYFICLPGFNAHTFMVGKTELKGNALTAAVKAEIERLIKKHKKLNAADSWDPEPHQAARGEFVTTAEIWIEISSSAYSFEQEKEGDFYRFFNASGSFNGADELEQVATDLNRAYPAELKRAFQRETLLEKLEKTIYGTETVPIVILGPEGVGRHSLLEELIFRYLSRHAAIGTPDITLKKIWHLDPLRIIAAMSVVGMWQKRFGAILDHLEKPKDGRREFNRDSILIDNPLALLRIGKSAQNSMTLSDMMKPYLERANLQFILIASPGEWELIQEKDRRFSDFFQVFQVNAPSEDDAVMMMLELRKKLERDFDCNISIPALKTLFDLQRSYFRKSVLPGSVADLLQELALKHRNATVDVEQVQAEFRVFSGLTVQMSDEHYVFEENEVEMGISSGLIGQPAALKALSNLVHQIKAKLQHPAKPLGSLLFVGPTGVGKTEAAKMLCRFLLGDEKKLIRLDMNEYIDAYSVFRLTGDAYNPEGLLGSLMRNQGFSVLLLDEIEKADPKVHDLFLQVLDEGHLTNALGRRIDFTNTVIIITSNAGAGEAASKLGFGTDARDEDQIYHKALEKLFRPEFINRIDEIAVFNSLGLEHILEIAKLQIAQLLSREGFVRRTTILNVAPDVLRWVAQRGFDSKMGGRALKRQIEKDLTLFSAEQLIQTSAAVPVIFDIQLIDNKLQPKIQPLEFKSAETKSLLPIIPGETQLNRFYKQLLQKLDALEAFLDTDYYFDEGYYEQDDQKHEDPAGDWRYYQLKNQIAAKKEELMLMQLEQKSGLDQRLNQQVFRLKNAGYNFLSGKNKSLTAEKLFEQQSLDELRYLYRHAPDQFRKSAAAYLNDYADIAILNIAAQAASANESDTVEIYISSMIEGSGDQFCNFLKSLYCSFLDDLDISYRLYDRHIEAEGYALYDLLKNESAYHLFYPPHQMALPLRVLICRAGERKFAEKASLSVLRIYDFRQGNDFKNGVITDLRSRFSCPGNLSPAEFKVLVFCGMDKADR